MGCGIVHDFLHQWYDFGETHVLNMAFECVRRFFDVRPILIGTCFGKRLHTRRRVIQKGVDENTYEVRIAAGDTFQVSQIRNSRLHLITKLIIAVFFLMKRNDETSYKRGGSKHKMGCGLYRLKMLTNGI